MNKNITKWSTFLLHEFLENLTGTRIAEMGDVTLIYLVTQNICRRVITRRNNGLDFS